MKSLTGTAIRKHKTPRQKKKMLLSNVSAFVLVVALGAGFGLLLNSANAMGTPAAPDFVHKAAVGNEFEIESSKLALQKSQDDNIRAFAQHMIDDHTKAGNDLVTAATDGNMETPDTTLDRKHQKMLAKLNAASGPDFNKLYVKDQVKAHDETVSLFKDYSKHGDNDAIKTFATDTLPTLQEHKQKIDQLSSSY